MSNSSSKGTALITGASRGYDFNLSKLEHVMFGADKVAAVGYESRTAWAEAHDCNDWEDFGRVSAARHVHELSA